MTEVWYRPARTVSLAGRPPTRIPLWYTQREDGTVVNTTERRTRTLVSIEFHTWAELRDSGVCTRVREVGSTVPFDPDLDMDEGL